MRMKICMKLPSVKIERFCFLVCWWEHAGSDLCYQTFWYLFMGWVKVSLLRHYLEINAFHSVNNRWSIIDNLYMAIHLVRYGFFHTFHLESPFSYLRPGSLSEASTRVTVPWHFCNIRAITASFSAGLNEHVEYTRRPPTSNNSNPRFNILACKLKGQEVIRHNSEYILFRFVYRNRFK